MSKAKNAVIAGDYEKAPISFQAFSKKLFVVKGFKKLLIDKSSVSGYEVMDSDQSKIGSAVTRGVLGGLLLGPVGVLAAASAKTNGVYVVALEWADGKKSLLEIDEKIYKELTKILF